MLSLLVYDLLSSLNAYSVCVFSLFCRSSKLLKGSGLSRIVITLLNLFWYTLKMYMARYGMYRLVIGMNCYVNLAM